ncbi:glycoside hydrolase family 125 protein [Copromyces sp. CBS 386.78]|nr:glycoside hydrolase family 125 protein [Copromyces sp. CBS 386.78]
MTRTTCWLSLLLPLSIPLLRPALVEASELVWDMDQVPVKGKFDETACPDYASYATYPHRPYSEGPLSLPFQRPHVRCRTFQSDAIEKVIKDVTSRMKNPDLARLFENTFPSTTDTTVKFHTNGKDGKEKKKTVTDSTVDDDPWMSTYEDPNKWAGPQSFIITGDILAEWLRDSTNQLKPYQKLALKDKAIFDLILGAINTQSEYVIESPYCNAFQPPPHSGLPVTLNGQDDTVHPAFDPSFVFECKYELDSLAHFLALINAFYAHTKSTDFLNSRWYKALDSVFDVLEAQSKSTFDPETGSYLRNQYTFQRRTDTGTETLNLGGIGNPLNNGTGLIRSAFRPSDDATIFGFFIPANAQMATELKRLAAMLRTTGDKKDITRAETAEAWSKTITAGIWEHGVVHHRKYGEVFAYEVDGYGSALMMDDANYPSLLALPLMGFVSVDDTTYQNTRKMLLEKGSNPYYLTGREFEGIGGPHIGLQNAWPMSLLVQAQTSDDDDEIMKCLMLVLNASKLGLIHESIDVNWSHSYTRSWFAWANGVFADTILDIAKRKPHLIFKDATPYEP